MSTGLKIFLFAIGALIAAFFIVLGITTATEGQKIANSGTKQAKEVSKEFSSIDRTIYDGTDVLGSTVVDLISTVIEEKEEFAICVKTNDNKTTGTYYNKAMNTTAPYAIITAPATAPSVAAPAKVTDTNYINPDALFGGKIYKDANNNIIGIVFTQID